MSKSRNPDHVMVPEIEKLPELCIGDRIRRYGKRKFMYNAAALNFRETLRLASKYGSPCFQISQRKVFSIRVMGAVLLSLCV